MNRGNGSTVKQYLLRKAQTAGLRESDEMVIILEPGQRGRFDGDAGLGGGGDGIQSAGYYHAAVSFRDCDPQERLTGLSDCQDAFNIASFHPSLEHADVVVRGSRDLSEAGTNDT